MKKFKILVVVSVVAIGVMLLLANDINNKKQQGILLASNPIIAKQNQNKNEAYRPHYPRQYDSWKKTKDSQTIIDMLDKKPQLAILWAGYGFAKDYNAPRGHFYALQDNINTLRTGAPVDAKSGPMPTACWTCKSPDVTRLIDLYGENEFFTGKWAKYGNEIVNPIGCADCHNPKTMELSVKRPHLDRALKSAGLPTFKDSTYQQKRSLVCAQCHTEYYFKSTKWTNSSGKEKVAKVATLPWAKGFKAEDMEAYYDEINFKDWTHKLSKTPMLKAQHPGYEIYQTGIHGKKGISCADCHMPYRQEGAVKYSDHTVGNPLKTMNRSCMNCHRESEKKLKDIVSEKLERKELLMTLAMDNLAKAHLEAKKAWEVGATKEEMKDILLDIRHGQWRWDYSIASHASFFHAPEETLKLLASANEKAQQARIKLIRVLAKHNILDYNAPDFSTKQKAQKLAGVNLAKLIEKKLRFKKTLEQEWYTQAIKKGNLNPAWKKGIDKKSSYFDN